MALPSPLTFSESRWPVAAEALEQSMLESKDKEQLVAIAQALGIKTTARAAKATLIDKILETTRPADPAPAPVSANGAGNGETNGSRDSHSADDRADLDGRAGTDVIESAEADDAAANGAATAAELEATEPVETRPARAPRGNGRAARSAPPVAAPEQEVLLGPDG